MARRFGVAALTAGSAMALLAVLTADESRAAPLAGPAPSQWVGSADWLQPVAEKKDSGAKKSSTGATDAGTLVNSLQQLKMLREQGVLSPVEHDNAQLRALASVNAQQTGIESGLALLRRLWENDLITQSPDARKRQKLLDAL